MPSLVWERTFARQQTAACRIARAKWRRGASRISEEPAADLAILESTSGRRQIRRLILAKVTPGATVFLAI